MAKASKEGNVALKGLSSHHLSFQNFTLSLLPTKNEILLCTRSLSFLIAFQNPTPYPFLTFWVRGMVSLFKKTLFHSLIYLFFFLLCYCLMSCIVDFQHHCRRCGGLFCNSCTQQRMVLRGQGDSPVRICDPCKNLEEAARFEMRHGHKNKSGKGALWRLIISWGC